MLLWCSYVREPVLERWLQEARTCNIIDYGVRRSSSIWISNELVRFGRDTSFERPMKKIPSFKLIVHDCRIRRIIVNASWQEWEDVNKQFLASLLIRYRVTSLVISWFANIHRVYEKRSSFRAVKILGIMIFFLYISKLSITAA